MCVERTNKDAAERVWATKEVSGVKVERAWRVMSPAADNFVSYR